MKKQVTSYVLVKYRFPKSIVIKARRDVPYEFKLTSRLILDEIMFKWNKQVLEDKINEAIDQQNIDDFDRLSKQYSKYIV
ncbi:IDEAL domain-containing protein [Alkalibacillus aidingensis]|uniref:IDEAL domain-containing protein n=1 Tax=Alkalibacillus aidingensis TaxID=2747607 RepID=UPI001661790F|nr:IDEAL domain-containing protein [Alkalibacillus aidingensis]